MLLTLICNCVEWTTKIICKVLFIFNDFFGVDCQQGRCAAAIVASSTLILLTG